MRIIDLKLKIREKLWTWLKNYFYYDRAAGSPVIRNLNYNCRPDQKRALVCYLTGGYYLNLSEVRVRRTHPFEIFTIINVLAEKGYTVDLVDSTDVKTINLVRNNTYDLIFGFGEVFYSLTSIQPSAVSVFYLTENHPDFSLQEETKRIRYFYERHGRKVPLNRSGRFYKREHLLKQYRHILTMSETDRIKAQYPHPYFIFPTGLINRKFVFENKDHSRGKKNFLWLGSAGAIHKGLDLLIDVFGKQEELTLHVCGLNPADRKLLNMKNYNCIIDYGHIDIDSDRYLGIVKTCSFIILPSCSEGFSTAITTGMLHGLIPVVMKNTGFNILGDKAIFLDDFRVEYISDVLNEISGFNDDYLQELSKSALEFAMNNFTIEAFEKSFSSAITAILKAEEEVAKTPNN